jgi:hypothetical protein
MPDVTLNAIWDVAKKCRAAAETDLPDAFVLTEAADMLEAVAEKFDKQLIFRFDRYVNGKKSGSRVVVSDCMNLEDAIAKAVEIAPKPPRVTDRVTLVAATVEQVTA